MSNRVELGETTFVLPLGLCAPQWGRFSSSAVPPADVGWARKGLSVGTTDDSCFTSLVDPCIPNTVGAFTCPNNATRINWSAGNWGNNRAVGAMFGANDAAGPFTAATGSFYDTTTTLARVNARVTGDRAEPLWPYVGPTWPVWLARGLGASMSIPTGGIAISTSPFNQSQARYLWGLTDGMIVHPDDQVRVASWVVPGAAQFPVYLNAPNASTSVAIGGVVADAYTGVNQSGATETARGMVVDLSNWLPSPAGCMYMKGFAMRS